MKYIIISIISFLFLTSCASNNQTIRELDKIEIINNSGFDISNAKIYSHKTKRMMKCSYIPKNGYCMYSFKRKENAKNSILIEWSFKGEVFKEEYVNIDTLKFNNKSAIRIRISLLKNGKYEIYKI